MKRVQIATIFILLAMVTLLGIAMAIDPPHDAGTNTQCNSCHSLHNAVSVSLTKEAENYNLCMSCHSSLGSASAKPFQDSNQATLTGGTAPCPRQTALIILTD